MQKYEALIGKLKEPSNEATAKARKLLYSVSIVNYLITQSGLMPTKFTFLGVTLKPSDQVTIIWLIFSILLYSSLIFILSAYSNWISWRAAQVAANEKFLMELKDFNIKHISDEYVLDHMKNERLVDSHSKRAFYMHTIFELALPILVGGVSIYWAYSAT